jgi:tetratricopeptide (TPR) repeat protein
VKKPQWIAAAVVLAAVLFLYTATASQIFGHHPKTSAEAATAAPTALTTDSILVHAKENLAPDQVARLSFLENSISRGDVLNQKEHIFHQLAKFWRDSARIFEPYAWYSAESARLENSEKSLTFAAHLILDNLRGEENPELKQWKATQAADLFERSLKINPANDSSIVGLGATQLFGGIGAPMQAIQSIRKVADDHPDDVYAQMTLGQASLLSGQNDKAIARFEKVAQLNPKNLEAILSLADTYERTGDKGKAVIWYKKSIPLIEVPGLKNEVEKRVNELSKN